MSPQLSQQKFNYYTANYIPNKYIRTLSVIVVITYNSWLAWKLNGTQAHLTGYLSDLAASNQPFNWFFRAGDFISAIIFAAIGIMGWRAWQWWIGKYARAVSVSVIFMALGTIADATFNLPCSSTTNIQCIRGGSLMSLLHIGSSTLVGAGLIASFCFVIIPLIMRTGWNFENIAIIIYAIFTLMFMMLTWLIAEVAPGAQTLVQILQVVLSVIWIAGLGWKIRTPNGDVTN